MKIKVNKEEKTLQVDNVIFTEKELSALLIPSDNGGDDDLGASYVKEGKEYIIPVRISMAGKKYFEENNCSAELVINDYGYCMFIWIYVPFKIYYNIIHNATVEYLLEVINQAI